MEENTNYQVTTGKNSPTLRMRLQAKFAALSYRIWCHRLYRAVFRQTLLQNVSKWRTTTICQRIMKRMLSYPSVYAIMKRICDNRVRKLSLKIINQQCERADFNKF